MSYYEQAKRVCPLCLSPMEEAVDEEGRPYSARCEPGYHWDAHQCTNAECGVQWQYGDIYRSEDDQARVIHIHDEAPRRKRAERSVVLHVGWSKDEDFPDGSVHAMVFVRPKPFRKRPQPLDLAVQATGLVSGDRDRALREAFSLWRLRAFA
jgi:hypothetical protein